MKEEVDSSWDCASLLDPPAAPLFSTWQGPFGE